MCRCCKQLLWQLMLVYIYVYIAFSFATNCSMCSVLSHTSLNKTRRQRDLLRVTHENQAILKRIQSKEPHYNHMQWVRLCEIHI